MSSDATGMNLDFLIKELAKIFLHANTSMLMHWSISGLLRSQFHDVLSQ